MIKIEIRNKNKFFIKGEIEKKNQINKLKALKNNQKNEDQLEENNILQIEIEG
jgi:hypothetical protein